MADNGYQRQHSPRANLGILLITVGIAVLAFQYVRIDLSWLPARWAELAWPLRIIVPGLALFVVGLVLPGSTGDGLAGFGLVAAAVGTLLWYQSVTGTWSSWAYAWALVFPGAGGVAGIVHGCIHGNWKNVRESLGAVVFGVVMFLVLGVVFEGMLGFEGFGLTRIASWIPGAVLLGLGVIVLFAGMPGEWAKRRAEGDRQRVERRVVPPFQASSQPRGPQQSGASAVSEVKVTEPTIPVIEVPEEQPSAEQGDNVGKS
jgi:hypothetical protein